LLKLKTPKIVFTRSKLTKLSTLVVDETNLKHSFFPNLLSEGSHAFGQGSSYLKFLGNPISVLKPYRAALYSLICLPSLSETLPVWNPKKQALVLQTSQVFADPTMKRALSNFTPSTRDLLLSTFHGSKPELLTLRPPLAYDGLSWDNHLWSLAAEALVLHFLVKDMGKDPRSFTDLLVSLHQDS